MAESVNIRRRVAGTGEREEYIQDQQNRASSLMSLLQVADHLAGEPRLSAQRDDLIRLAIASCGELVEALDCVNLPKVAA